MLKVAEILSRPLPDYPRYSIDSVIVPAAMLSNLQINAIDSRTPGVVLQFDQSSSLIPPLSLCKLMTSRSIPQAGPQGQSADDPGNTHTEAHLRVKLLHDR